MNDYKSILKHLIAKTSKLLCELKIGALGLILVVAGCTGNKQQDILFQIEDNGKIGFIDSTGHIVIEPNFFAAGKFSEGLAFARLNGSYGFIDPTGKFIIQPSYDYAESFHEGLAIVYKDSIPFYINKDGKKAFACNYKSLGSFKNDKALIVTYSNKYGIIDNNGKLIIDTVFGRIEPFVDGRSVVTAWTDPKDKSAKDKTGVIDSIGNWIIAYEKFNQIEQYENGYFKVGIPAEAWDTVDGSTAKTALVDKTGKVILALDGKNSQYIDGVLKCGLAKTRLYKYWIPEESGVLYSTQKCYEGFMNLKGEICINDTNFYNVEEFYNNRAFVRDKDRNYSIINTKGKIVSETIFDNIVEPGFKNGIAFVSIGSKWGMIDTNANFIVEPEFDEISTVGMVDDYFFFAQNDTNSKNEDPTLYGVAAKNGVVLVKPIMKQFDKSGFQHGLLQCIINDRLSYINKKGEVVWQEAEIKTKKLKNLNIDFMNRGYFHAYSKPKEKEISGFARSENFPEKISTKYNFPSNSLCIIVKPESKDTIYGDNNGIEVFIANTSKQKFDFNAQDSRLYMKVQALNPKGKWQDIEYLPSSWCGNSYHTLTLDPDYFWRFVTPIYEGDFKTKLRIEARYIDPSDKSEIRWMKKEIKIYSNEYQAGINPGQFWRKRDYYPNGIMDPYNN